MTDLDQLRALENRVARALKFLERFRRTGAYQDLFAAIDTLKGDL